MWVGIEVAVGFDEEVFGEALVYRTVADKYIDGTGIYGVLGAGLRLDGMICLDRSVATMKLITLVIALWIELGNTTPTLKL